MLKRAGIAGTGKLNARSYLQWGEKLDKPVPGCVVVFSRGNPKGWQGHVAFYVGEDAENIEVLGGNQKNAVNVSPYRKKKFLGYRWPSGVPMPDAQVASAKQRSGDNPAGKDKRPKGWKRVFGILGLVALAVLAVALAIHG